MRSSLRHQCSVWVSSLVCTSTQYCTPACSVETYLELRLIFDIRQLLVDCIQRLSFDARHEHFACGNIVDQTNAETCSPDLVHLKVSAIYELFNISSTYTVVRITVQEHLPSSLPTDQRLYLFKLASTALLLNL